MSVYIYLENENCLGVSTYVAMIMTSDVIEVEKGMWSKE